MKFKKSIVVDAVRYDGTLQSIEPLKLPEAHQHLGSTDIEIPISECGKLIVHKGDFIVKHESGYIEALKPDQFEKQYEASDTPLAS